jgi:hypothetical protein
LTAPPAILKVLPSAKERPVPKLAAFAALAGLLAVGPALAQSQWAQPQIREMDAAFGQPIEGLTFEGAAPSGDIGVVKVTVPASGRYAFVGSCGGDCVDIGLILNRDGKPVAQGVTGFKSALPAGDYELKIGFDACKEAQCRYVVRVYKAG